MIIGECPYCDETEMNEIPDGINLPCLGEITCDNCKSKYWLKFSRFDAKAYTQEDFHEEYSLEELHKCSKSS